jgi:hypothetical protein
MRISEKHKFVFVTTPKVATQSLFVILKMHFSPLISVGEHNLNIPEEYKDYFTWSVCRNPYTRMFSAWWALVGSGSKRPGNKPRAAPFDKYLNFKTFTRLAINGGHRVKPHNTRQTDRFTHFRNDMIIRFEYLEADFLLLPFVTTPIKFVCINTKEDHARRGRKTLVPKYSDVFTQEIADAIYKWEKPIFKRFNYDEDSWKELP